VNKDVYITVYERSRKQLRQDIDP